MDYLDISYASNPWKTVVEHPFNQLLMLSDTPHFSLRPSHQVEAEHAEFDVAKKLGLLRELSACAQEIHQVRLAKKRVALESESFDLVRCAELEKKLDDVKKLVANLESTIKNQDLLAAKLQQPEQEEHLLLEAKYQPDAISLFENAAKCVSSLQEQCDTLKWHKHNINNQMEGNDNRESLRTVSQRYLKTRDHANLMDRICKEMKAKDC